MSKIDLLSVVQPENGWFAIVGIKDSSVKQYLTSTRLEVDAYVKDLLSKKYDVYFGVAKYHTGKNRLKDNVKGLKAFWVDIDCGENKAVVNEVTGRPDGYATKALGIAALQKFCGTTGLHKPILVDSGRGIHAYWTLSEEVTREQWEHTAARFREVCVAQDFYVDPSVFEVARILRVPDTLNFKDDPPSEVKVLTKGTSRAQTIEALNTLLGVKPQVERPKKRELTALAKSMTSNLETKFSKIMLRSARGEGCQQLLYCYQNQATLGYDLWTATLSVLNKCDDLDSAMDKMCGQYPEYDKEASIAKAATFEGPFKCSTFSEYNPGGCDGCPHLGKIKSPISLGKIYKSAASEDNEVIVDGLAGTKETLRIPKYPDPYFRGKNGGVYFAPLDEEAEAIRVYEYDFYVIKRMTDPNLGDVILFRLHLPKDGIKEFVVSNACVADKNTLRKELAMHGILCSEKRFGFLIEYVILSVKELQYRRKAELMRLQFGWVENNSKFILGDREITAEGVYHSPPSSATKELIPYLQEAGTLDKWKEVFSLYGAKGLEPHAFAALTAFGAPLLRFFGQNGAIINVIHPQSGTGKTTILHMCNSVYGNPKLLCSTQQDTMNSRIMKLGIMNNLPYCVDEITNMTPKDFSDLAYSMSQGRGKDRMKAQTNELRANTTSWQTISLCSANASFAEKLSVLKANPDGELMRLLEYKIESHGEIPTTVAKEMFDHQLHKNYGHAGEIYIKHLVSNLESVVALAKQIQGKLDKELKLTQRERFWSAVVAANITGGLIAENLGLIDWDMKAIYKWVTGMVQEMRQDVTPPISEVVSVLGDYYHRHVNNILTVNDASDGRSNLSSAPIQVPQGELLIRYEPDREKLYFTAKAFRIDCVESQINYKETLAELSKKGIFLGVENKRLSKGMSVAAPAVRCVVFDASGEDFTGLSLITAEEETAEEKGDE